MASCAAAVSYGALSNKEQSVTQEVEYSKNGGIATITLNRPSKANTLRVEVLEGRLIEPRSDPNTINPYSHGVDEVELRIDDQQRPRPRLRSLKRRRGIRRQ